MLYNTDILRTNNCIHLHIWAPTGDGHSALEEWDILGRTLFEYSVAIGYTVGIQALTNSKRSEPRLTVRDLNCFIFYGLHGSRS